jgi:hypothetical protein
MPFKQTAKHIQVPYNHLKSFLRKASTNQLRQTLKLISFSIVN